MDKASVFLLLINAVLYMCYGTFVSTSPTLTIMAFVGSGAMLLLLWGITHK